MNRRLIYTLAALVFGGALIFTSKDKILEKNNLIKFNRKYQIRAEKFERKTEENFSNVKVIRSEKELDRFYLALEDSNYVLALFSTLSSNQNLNSYFMDLSNNFKVFYFDVTYPKCKNILNEKGILNKPIGRLPTAIVFYNGKEKGRVPCFKTEEKARELEKIITTENL